MGWANPWSARHETFRTPLRQALPVSPSVRPETVIFSVLVAFLGWWLLDLPPLQKAVVTAIAVVAFVLASAAIERWRRA